MKKLFLVILVCTGIMVNMTGNMIYVPNHDSTITTNFLVIPQEKKDAMQKETPQKTVYTCPMHPEVVQEKSGKCPKCGMNLKSKEIKKDVYSCSMHSEVNRDKEGKCPECGMKLVLKTTSEISKK